MNDDTPIIKRASVDLSRFTIQKGGSERGELLEKFLERVNRGRTESGYPAITMKRLAHMLAHIPTDQLYPFYRDCERAQKFSAYFWWSLKPRDKNETKARKLKG